jgi:UDP-glucose 4-epimerase
MTSTPPQTDWRSLHGDAFANRRVLVTGGCGFIGSHVTDALATLGAAVTVLDDLSEGTTDYLPASARFVRGSLLDPTALAEAMVDAEVVFHLAALVSVPRSVEKPTEYHTVNATGTLNVLETARRCGVRRVVYSASSSAYGDSETLPKTETLSDLPQSPYAASKLVGEHYVRAYARCYPIDAVSLRYFNIFGPRQKADSAYAGVVAAFAKTLLAGKRPTIYGDGTASRDFTFVHNAVHANLLAARRQQPFRGEVINVATARQLTVKQLAEAMARLLGREDLSPHFAPPRAGDVQHSLADLARARRELGYEPIVPFEPGLAATLAWYRHPR